MAADADCRLDHSGASVRGRRKREGVREKPERQDERKGGERGERRKRKRKREGSGTGLEYHDLVTAKANPTATRQDTNGTQGDSHTVAPRTLDRQQAQVNVIDDSL
jgi:hypothetical protein